MSKKEAYQNRIERLFDETEPTHPEPKQMPSLLPELQEPEAGPPDVSPSLNGHDHLALMAEVGRLVAGREAAEQVLEGATGCLAARLKADLVQLFAVDATGKVLDLLAAAGNQGLGHSRRLPANAATLVGLAAMEQKGYVWEYAAAGSLPLPPPPSARTRAELAVPLQFSGKVLGVLDLHRTTGGGFTALERLAIDGLAGQLATVLENNRLDREAQQSRRETETAAAKIKRAGWEEFLDAIERRERIGYAYDQQEVRPLDNPPKANSQNGVLHAPLALGGEQLGMLQLERDPAEEVRPWNPEEARLVSSIAERVAQQVENLRLLNQAERYRRDAELAARRLTRQGWEEFLDAIERAERMGYAYDHSQVTPTDQVPQNGALRADLQISGEALGTVFVEPQDGRSLAPDQVRLLQSVSQRVAQHIENLRLLARAEKYRKEAEQAAKRLTLEAWDEYQSQTPALTGGYVYNQKRVLKFDPGQPAGQPETARKKPIQSTVRVREQKIGHLMVEVGEAPAPEHSRMVDEVAERLGTHIENLRLLDETERARQQLDKRAAELETVAKVSTAAASILSPEELLQTVVDLTKSSFKLYHVGVFLLEDDDQALRMVAGAGEVGRQMMDNQVRIPVSREPSIIALAARTGEGVNVADVYESGNFWPHPLLQETRSELAVPMIVGRRMIGVFDVQSETVGRFQEEDLRTYATLASQVAVALQNAELYAEQAVTVERLRELDHLKSAFLANMSHELRTPLNSILGFTQVIMEGIDGPLTDNMQMDLELIEKNGKHLLNLINEVLDYAKIEAGRMSMAMEPLDFRELLQDVIETTAPLAREKNLYMRIENAPGVARKPLFIAGDQMRLRQVVLNLLGNAIKFTDNGGILVEIGNILKREDAEFIQVRVRDTGIGIPPNKLESIFEAFSQVDTSTVRKVGGTGLGLPISRRLVEMHGGWLWAESTGIPGEGSVFCIELPVRRLDGEKAARTSEGAEG